MGEADIESRLRNWGRAMYVRPHRLRTGSLEGRYRSPQRNLWEEPVPRILGAVDMHDAWVVELACATLPMSRRLVLRLHYCWHAHPIAIRRIVHRHTRRKLTEFNGELAMAQNAIAAALCRTETQNRHSVRVQARLVLDMRVWAAL